MQDLYALNSAAQRVFESREEMGIDFGFTASSSYISAGSNPGDIVKLGTDGTVSLVAASTDYPIGIVVVPKVQRNAVNRVTVATPFQAVIRANIAGAINAGTHLAATGHATAADGTVLTTYAAASSGDWVTAIMIKTTSGASEVTNVGYLRTPYKKA